MKKAVLATCIASISTLSSANVFLPSIGIDGWDSDSQYFRSMAFNQGYLTASDAQNHTVNPAFALALQDTAEARMYYSTGFSGGAFTQVFGQNVGIYFGRRTFDDYLYYYDSNGSGLVDTSVDSSVVGDIDGDGNDDTISNLFDAYWASAIGTGDLGVRLNVRALSSSMESDMQDDTTSVTTEGGLYEFNTTVGFISNSLPLEGSVTLGLPFGSLEDVNEDTDADTKTVEETSIDKGLRWGALAKYTLSEDNQARTVLSGFIGSANANYDIVNETTTGGSTTTNSDVSFIQERFTFGLVASHERMINNRTRLIASAGLNRTSSTQGVENKAADPSQPDYDEYGNWWLPVSIGTEFRKSEKTTLIGSVASNLFDRDTNANYDNDGGDAAKEDESSMQWTMPNSNVQFGFAYQMTPRLSTNLVINKALFVSGLDEGLTTVAEFRYEF
ncbi:hypothetical protein [Saccharospirillum salsuginis]|uniref:Uncharacterized protein n=1 Tax=Saccharospirillum salsuginis TaxID=418750 RepID=A0A918K6Q8_9GAMM|nr:hypothetical protein [Saccharospirillum salsuginis]GGX49951.1 hypothetical protein GCM10007392_16700 [Saccharospirillum salsuginis]